MASLGVLQTLKHENAVLKNQPDVQTDQDESASEAEDFDMTEGPTAEECSPYEEKIDKFLKNRLETVPDVPLVSNTDSSGTVHVDTPNAGLQRDFAHEETAKTERAQEEHAKKEFFQQESAQEQEIAKKESSLTPERPEKSLKSLLVPNTTKERFGVHTDEQSTDHKNTDLDQKNQVVLEGGSDRSVCDMEVESQKQRDVLAPQKTNYSQWATSVTKSFNASKKLEVSSSRIPTISKRALTMPPSSELGNALKLGSKNKKDLKRSIKTTTPAAKNSRQPKKLKKTERRLEQDSIDGIAQPIDSNTVRLKTKAASQAVQVRDEHVPKPKKCYQKWKSVGLFLMGAVLASVGMELYERLGSSCL